MRIAVIGAGNIGRTLGGKWAAAGHQVVYGVRSPGAPGTASVADAVAAAEVVVLAVPGAAAKDVLATLGAALAGKVVIDATNDIQGTGKLHALDELDRRRPSRPRVQHARLGELRRPRLRRGHSRPLLRGRGRPREGGRRPSDRRRRTPARLARRRRRVRPRRLADPTLVHTRLPAQARPPARLQDARSGSTPRLGRDSGRGPRADAGELLSPTP